MRSFPVASYLTSAYEQCAKNISVVSEVIHSCIHNVCMYIYQVSVKIMQIPRQWGGGLSLAFSYGCRNKGLHKTRNISD
jgi:hypothetical protein